MDATRSFLLGIVLTSASFGGALALLDMPIVYVSPWGECLRVDSPSPEHNCTALPRRYLEVYG